MPEETEAKEVQTITVSGVEKALLKNLRALAKAEGRSLSNYIVQSLKKEADGAKGRKRPRRSRQQTQLA